MIWTLDRVYGRSSKCDNSLILDRLAARGCCFTNAQCQAPICAPPGPSMMSGLRPIYYRDFMAKLTNEESVGSSRRKPLEDIFFLSRIFKNNWVSHSMGPKESYSHNFGTCRCFSNEAVRGEKRIWAKPEKNFKWDKKGTSTELGRIPEEIIQMPD